MWYGIEENTREETGEDFTEYSTLEEALEAGLEYISVLIQNKEEIEKEGKCHIYWPTEKYYGDDDSRPE